MHTARRHGHLTISIVSTRERSTAISHDGLKKISTFGDSGISRIHRESGDQKRLCANENQRETHSMTKCSLLSVAVILSTAIAAPVFAQTVKQEPSAYALYLPNGALGVGSAPSQRQDAPTVSHGTAEAMASAPSIRPWAEGNEIETRLGSARGG